MKCFKGDTYTRLSWLRSIQHISWRVLLLHRYLQFIYDWDYFETVTNTWEMDLTFRDEFVYQFHISRAWSKRWSNLQRSQAYYPMFKHCFDFNKNLFNKKFPSPLWVTNTFVQVYLKKRRSNIFGSFLKTFSCFMFLTYWSRRVFCSCNCKMLHFYQYCEA